jgi:hypothetical protein
MAGIIEYIKLKLNEWKIKRTSQAISHHHHHLASRQEAQWRGAVEIHCARESSECKKRITIWHTPRASLALAIIGPQQIIYLG